MDDVRTLRVKTEVDKDPLVSLTEAMKDLNAAIDAVGAALERVKVIGEGVNIKVSLSTSSHTKASLDHQRNNA